MKNRPYYNIIIPVILLFIILPRESYSQVILNRTIVAPNGRSILYFNEMPEFKSSLSSDKKKVVINIKNANVDERAKVANSSGVIESVYAQIFGDDLTISLILREKMGYTIAPMPFSNSIIVEVFSWDNLSATEDNYRSGLLAMESKIYLTARNYFEKASVSGHINSKAFLGMLKLKNGDLDNALLLLKEAEKGNSDIFDLFAAISQVHELNGDQKDAIKYKDLFTEKTSLHDFPRLIVDYKSDGDGSPEEPISFLQTITYDEQKAKIENEQNMEKDTLSESKQFENLFKNDTTQANKPTSDPAEYSLFDNGVDTLLIYIISFFIAFALLITYLFIRWRKKQLSFASREDRQEFKRRLAEAREEVKIRKEYAAALKAEDAGKLIDKITESKTGDSEKDLEQEKYIQTAKQSLIKSKDVKNADDSVPDETEDNDTEISEKIESIEEIDLTEYPKKSPEKKSAPSARIEMALNLVEEQRKVKTKKLESLQKQSLSVDAHKLSDVAQKLGIEKGGLEIKMIVEKMKTDKESLSKLTDKFSVIKNKGKGNS